MRILLRTKTTALFVALSLAACGGEGAPAVIDAGLVKSVKYENYCSVPDMLPALRQTFIVLDENLLVATQTAADFASKNQRLRDAVLAFADPGSSLEQGRSAPRERITVLLAPIDGGTAKQIFTGCIPGLSTTDRAALANTQSATAKFFAGGSDEKFMEGADDFTAILVGALVNAAQRRSREAAATQPKFFDSLRGFGTALRTESARRVVLVSNAVEVVVGANESEARAAAFLAAKTAGFDFGNADVLLIGDGGNNPLRVAYMDAWLVAQAGRLAGWSNDPSGLSYQPAPTKIERFMGTSRYPDGQELVTKVRLAYDDNGKLVDSWLILSDMREAAIPLTGQAICQQNNACDFRSDKGGFAQSWIAERGSEPKFDENAPYAGLREWSMTVSGAKLQGEVFDSAVDRIGKNASSKTIPFTATAQQKATF